MDSYNFKVNRQETWEGITITYFIDGNPVDLTSALIYLHVKKYDCDSDPILSLSLEDGITIQDASNGIFTVEAREFDLTPREYYYDIRIERNGAIEFPLKGALTIEQTITRL